MKLTGESKLLLGIILVTVIIIGVAAIIFTKPAPVFSQDEMIPSSAYTKGNRDAKVYLVEFSDFQCPFCKLAKVAVDDVLKTYGDTIVFSYRHFPIESHVFGEKAAQAAEAAGSQGKFWEMHDLLFENQEKFSDSLFLELAKQLGLDEKKFTEELTNSTYRNKVLEDRSAGLRFGVSGTPTFFLNGKKVQITNFNDLSQVVKQALETTK